jgi:hypothetical protein
MCGLCGVFGETSHWSTQGVANGVSRRQRFFRIQTLSRVLGLIRYSIRDFSGMEYVVSTPTGNQAMVKEMGQLWQEVEKMRGRPLDPLDEECIQAYARILGESKPCD